MHWRHQGHEPTVHIAIYTSFTHMWPDVDGLVQECRNTTGNAPELRLSGTNP